jgi:hypothetical protein
MRVRLLLEFCAEVPLALVMLPIVARRARQRVAVASVEATLTESGTRDPARFVVKGVPE